MPLQITCEPYCWRYARTNLDQGLVTIGEYLSRFHWVEVLGIVYWRDLFINEYVRGKSGPGEGIGNGFLRSKAEKWGLNGLVVFIAELLLSQHERMITLIEEEDQGARAYGIPDNCGVIYILQRTAHDVLWYFGLLPSYIKSSYVMNQTVEKGETKRRRK